MEEISAKGFKEERVFRIKVCWKGKLELLEIFPRRSRNGWLRKNMRRLRLRRKKQLLR